MRTRCTKESSSAGSDERSRSDNEDSLIIDERGDIEAIMKQFFGFSLCGERERKQKIVYIRVHFLKRYLSNWFWNARAVYIRGCEKKKPNSRSIKSALTYIHTVLCLFSL